MCRQPTCSISFRTLHALRIHVAHGIRYNKVKRNKHIVRALVLSCSADKCDGEIRLCTGSFKWRSFDTPGQNFSCLAKSSLAARANVPPFCCRQPDQLAEGDPFFCVPWVKWSARVHHGMRFDATYWRRRAGAPTRFFLAVTAIRCTFFPDPA